MPFICHLKVRLMKFVITGAAGHVSKPLALQLLHAGHSVTTVGRNADHLAELALAGASMAIGSVEGRVFINHVFAGADSVYTMCPPDIHVNNLTGYCEAIATNYAESIAANRISYVVNLSSVGAHMPTGAGHITGMHRTEAILNQLENVNIRHLRPVFFLT